MLLRYGVAAMVLAYLAKVFVSQRSNFIDVKGQILEQRIDSYIKIHGYVIRLKNLIATPSQTKNFYAFFLRFFKFNIDYQGYDYCSFFHTPEALIHFGTDISKLVDKSTIHLDHSLEQELNAFQWWMDDVIVIVGAFIETETDARWGTTEKTKDENCELATQLLGIVLQDDICTFYNRFDRLLRDRLQRIRITRIQSDSLSIRLKRRLTKHCEARTYKGSQLRKHSSDILLLLSLVHYSEEVKNQRIIQQSMDVFMDRVSEFEKCLKANIDKGFQRLYA